MRISEGQGLWSALLIGAALAAGAESAYAAQAVSPPPAPAVSAADQVFESQKTAYDALSEADRRAIQDALVWTGDYNGVVDGAFGKRTRDSILAYQASVKTPTTGVIDAAQLAALLATADKAKAAVKFQIVADDKTGVRIGAPLKLIDKRAGLGAGTRLMSADGATTLDLAAVGGGEANLAALYARLSADAPGRKVTLKLSRPEYFVVSGEEGGRKFYARYAKAPPSWPDPSLIRSFTLAYSAQSTSFDRIGVAIANSFDPFATTPLANAAMAAAAKPAPAKPALAASGFVVAAGEALTTIDSAECPRPSIDGKPAKYLHEDKQAGLSLIGAGFAENAASPLVLGPIGDDLVALTYAAEEAGAKPALEVAAIAPLAQTKDDARPLLVASLPQNAAGSPIFDRSGALVAIVARPAVEAKTVSGVTPLAPHPVVAAPEIERFLTGADVATTKAGGTTAGVAGRIAADKRALVVAIVCN